MTDKLFFEIADIVSDPEFRYDYSLINDTDEALEQVMKDSKLLNTVLSIVKYNVESDIELEESCGADTESLYSILKEINQLLV